MEGNAVSDGELRLDYISPEDLRSVWETVKPGLENVSKIANEWIIEDVYSAILNNHSTLHIGYRNNRYMGFLVLTPIVGFCETKLHIWAAYSDQGGFDLLESTMVEINELARRIKAKEITFDTHRKGWEKVADKLGFEPLLMRYSRKV